MLYVPFRQRPIDRMRGGGSRNILKLSFALKNIFGPRGVKIEELPPNKSVYPSSLICIKDKDKDTLYFTSFV